MRLLRVLLTLTLLALAGTSAAADVCGGYARGLQSMQYGDRIAGAACYESLLWYSPFIDSEGRLASIQISEAESGKLSDGFTPAWKRVAAYWLQSGLMGHMAGFPGASDCSRADGGHWQTASCRAFLVDRPWSAAFVSFVMMRAGVPGFRASPSHVDYVRDAYLRPDSSPFIFLDPLSAAAKPGDLMCFSRGSSRVMGHAGLMQFFDSSANSGLLMHCDIVVDNSGGIMSTIGGNVLQGVTLRRLPVNREGVAWALPRKTGNEPPCRPDAEQGCNFNRQDWVVLLKLKALPPATRMVPSGPLDPGATANCCINCVVGENVPRCPNPQAPARIIR